MRGGARGGRGGARGGGRGGGRGGRGGARGGRGGAKGGRGGAKGGSNVIVKPHRHEGVFVAEGKEHLLVTKNLVPGESVYTVRSVLLLKLRALVKMELLSRTRQSTVCGIHSVQS